MATYYSSFFNSGLRAADSDLPSRPNPTDPATPRAFKTSFDDTTPKSDSYSMPASASSNNVLPSLLSQVTDPIPTSANANRPHMRRRRSSLSLSASPVTALKSAPSIPRATVNLQRNSIGVVTANRVRSGSITELLSRAAMTANANSDATNANSLMGRLRSGSVGTSLRSTSRRLRKQASVPAPAPPPPTSPLPDVPQLTITTNTIGMSSRPVTPRPKFGGRAHTTESIPIVVNTPGRDDTMLSSPLGARSFAHSEGGEAMDTDDYPTPLETPGEVQGDSYF